MPHVSLLTSSFQHGPGAKFKLMSFYLNWTPFPASGKDVNIIIRRIVILSDFSVNKEHSFYALSHNLC